MASYNTNLKTWGASGSVYPDGYNYSDGEQPVDEWDNFVNSNLISDVKDHLIPLTNSRVESDVGPAGGEPASPETSHVYHDQDGERLELWDTDKAGWRDIMFRDGDTMTGALNMGNYPVEGHTDLVDNNGNVVWDYSSGYIPQDRLQNDTVTVNAGTGISSAGTVSLGGSLTVSVDDNRYILESGDTMSGGLTLQDGSTAASQSWVNSNADVPNADHADNADTIDGVEESELANQSVGVENPTYASKADVPNSISKGETVFIDGDGLYVEDGN